MLGKYLEIGLIFYLIVFGFLGICYAIYLWIDIFRTGGFFPEPK